MHRSTTMMLERIVLLIRVLRALVVWLIANERIEASLSVSSISQMYALIDLFGIVFVNVNAAHFVNVAFSGCWHLGS